MAKEKPTTSMFPAAGRSNQTDRGSDSSSATIPANQHAQLPTAVRVLLEFDHYPRDLVHAAYQQLLSAAYAAESGQGDVNGNDDATSPSDVSKSSVPYVTAESLARFVEAMMMNPAGASGAAVSALLSPACSSLSSGAHVGLGRGEYPPHRRTEATGGGNGAVGDGNDDGDLKTDDDGKGELGATGSRSPRAPGAPTVTNSAITTTGASTTANTSPAPTGVAAGAAVTTISAHTTAAVPKTTGASELTGNVATSRDFASTGDGHPATDGPSAENGVDKTEKRRRQQQRLHALTAENRRLKRRNVCRQCRQKPVDLTLLPCGHLLFCQECGAKFSECPACLKTILADVKTFMS